MESMDVEFIEDKFYNDSKLIANPTPAQENDLNPSISWEKEKRVHDLSTEPSWSQRVRKVWELCPFSQTRRENPKICFKWVWFRFGN